MDIVERWRERKRKRLQERKRKRLQERERLGIMHEDMVDANGAHHSPDDGRYVSPNGGESGPENENGKTSKPGKHVPAKEITRIKNELSRRLVGKKTRTGLKITKIDPHVAIRAAQRNIWVDNIVSAVLEGKREKRLDKDGNCAFLRNRLMVGITPKGVVKTVIYYGEDKKGKKKK